MPTGSEPQFILFTQVIKLTMLTNQQFDRTRRLALNLAGIELVERHRDLLDRRSRRIGICDSAGLDSLLCAAEEGQTTAMQQLLCLLTTKFTGFFRHPQHFNLAAEHALQAAHPRGHVRLWSAGTATGEEAWSLAIALIEVFQRSDPPISLLATDVDSDALAIAQHGEYSEASVRTISAARREHFLNETHVPRRWCVGPAVRRLVEFRTLNLVSKDWSLEGPFDVIFCRNVLMYLEARHRDAVLARMATLLTPDGLLMLDPTEHLGTAAPLFRPGVEGVYSVRSAWGTRADE
jgi:chemotaxis protein methyltransferase CheR